MRLLFVAADMSTQLEQVEAQNIELKVQIQSAEDRADKAEAVAADQGVNMCEQLADLTEQASEARRRYQTDTMLCTQKVPMQDERRERERGRVCVRIETKGQRVVSEGEGTQLFLVCYWSCSVTVWFGEGGG